MRQIEKDMGAAILSRRQWKLKNTEVYCEDSQVMVTLHGHCIALISFDEHGSGVVDFSFCGWPTTTTRSRLNAIASTLGLTGRFYQKAGVQFFGDSEVDSGHGICAAMAFEG